MPSAELRAKGNIRRITSVARHLFSAIHPWGRLPNDAVGSHPMSVIDSMAAAVAGVLCRRGQLQGTIYLMMKKTLSQPS